LNQAINSARSTKLTWETPMFLHSLMYLDVKNRYPDV
jgi:hypothetical protein